ncbi:TRAP transporter small permease [Marinobacter sp. 1_MG-2023]|uniref:TRAP transporter small permease n=1 Tax=Marinobacter sp. 1_MG-2023 TaxID=3062627 RepID=UPI0026E21B06|nr:TRAP transporter small permease [Marinobacter sp. 1_MG-2023]MDO6822762.1 TRAP transporter small permease [Marinobacter sp. 1_MG-2023]
MSTLANSPSPVKYLDCPVRHLENLLVAIAALMILVAMVVTCMDVFMRYVLSMPLSWSFDFIVLYLLPGSYFLAFSYALRVGTHLKVDYFASYINRRLRGLVLFLVGLISVVLFAYISWFYLIEAYHAWQDGEVMGGVIPWPVWPGDFIVFISSLAFALRLLIVSLEHLQLLLVGAEK